MKSLLFRKHRISATTRIAIALAMWSATVLLALRLVGVIDDGQTAELRHRANLAQSTAVACSQAASQNRLADAAVLMRTLRERNPDLLSIALRDSHGALTVVAGDHDRTWQAESRSLNRIEVPIFNGDRVAGELQMVFAPIMADGWRGYVLLPSVRITLLALMLNFLGFFILLKRSFRRFDPSQVVPERVRTALDTLAEVVLVVDQRNRIMFSNRRLGEVMGDATRNLQGHSLYDLPWAAPPGNLTNDDTGARLTETDQGEWILNVAPEQQRVFKLNRSPILDDDGTRQGTLISLDDITEIRRQHDQLQEAMTQLEISQAEIQQQNERLARLATRDSLTGCFNRRAFFETFGKVWESAARYHHPLSCLMVDIDHFKSINDRFGHAVGDDVLKQVGKTLQATARDSDIVCRYGGEEFCILLPHVDLDGAARAAERIRQAIAALAFRQLKVTASLGCSDRLQGAASPEAMLEQADQALYDAKQSGRNRVARFDLLAFESDDDNNPLGDNKPLAQVGRTESDNNK